LKTWIARTVTYSVVAALAATTLVYIRPIPERRAAEVLRTDPTPSWREHVDSVGSGETLGKVFIRGGMPDTAVAAALRVATSVDPRRIRVGTRVTFGALPADSAPRQITLRLAVDRVLHLTRDESGWTAREDTLPWRTDTLIVRGAISSTLYDALDSAATDLPAPVRTALAWDVADVFQWRIDMSRDLQVGDVFGVLVERQQGPDGAVRTGRILAATFRNGGATIQAIRHERAGDRARYYDQDGKSLEANFLRAPLEFRRISSIFGLRKHPILGIWRRHQGTDYAAASGTPVRAIGDGIVLSAGVRGGYGNAIDVRHANGFVTRYGHLRGFARGIHAGTRVAMGQTIGFVGMTGLATAPHLHFEVLVAGEPRDPRSALARTGGAPLPSAERTRFDANKGQYLALLERRAAGVVASTY
jgi:murein DD-endopeptidase MepM/ murein hydrolase activator NlpD